MIPDGLEPSLTGCEPGVVAAGPRDRGERSVERREMRARNDYPVWLSSLISPLSSVFSGSRGTRTHKRDELATCFQDRALIRSDDFRMSPFAPQKQRPFSEKKATVAAGAGVEPTSQRSERRILPIDDPAVVLRWRTHLGHPGSPVKAIRYDTVRGTGGTRTHARVLNKHLLCR